MARKKSPDRAYLVRCWQEGGAAPGTVPRWRFSAEEVLHDRRRQGFGDLEALIAFLRAELGSGEWKGGKLSLQTQMEGVNLMSLQENKDIVQRVVDLFNENKLEHAREYFASNFSNHDPSAPAVLDRNLGKALENVIL